MQLIEHAKSEDQLREEESRAQRRSMHASGVSSNSSPMLSSSSSGGNYNGNAALSNSSTHGERSSYGAALEVSASASASATAVSSNNSNHKLGGNRVMQTNSACLNNFLFPVLTDVSDLIFS